MEMNVKEMWYKELANSISEIKEADNVLSDEEKREQHIQIVEHAKRLCSISRVGREEGLLALEMILDGQEDLAAEIHTGIKMICDACDPVDVEAVLWNKYFVRQPKGYDALHYLMNMKGMLEIQGGVHPYLLNEFLCSMMPDEVEKMYRKCPNQP